MPAKSVMAHTQYVMNTGDAVPGVTTVLNILSKPALVVWANRLGLQGIDSTKYKDKMADIGTIAHLMIMAELSNTTPDLKEYSQDNIDVAQTCLGSFHEWRKSHNIEPIMVETPIVSDIHGYGGTPDCLAYVNGELELLDFKTGNAIYHEYYYQIAAYRQILIEKGYDTLNRARILRIGKNENEGFEDRLVTRFNDEFMLFLHCLAIYNLLKTMKRAL